MSDELTTGVPVSLAFGLFVRALPDTSEFARLHSVAAGLELADSITVDGHKLLNVVRSAIRSLSPFLHLHACFSLPIFYFLLNIRKPKLSLTDPTTALR